MNAMMQLNTQHAGATDRVRTALLVDHESVVLKILNGGHNGVANGSENGEVRYAPENIEAAIQFIHKPELWLNWICDQLSKTSDFARGVERDILVREAYTNPHMQRHRSMPPQFRDINDRLRGALTQAGFGHTPCSGPGWSTKNSADAFLYTGAFQALMSQMTRYDEFVIVGCDTDYRPLMGMLKKFDRRTAMVSVGPSAPAFHALCECILDIREWVAADAGEAAASNKLSEADARELADTIANSAGPGGRLAVPELIPYFKALPAFANRDWFGFGRASELLVYLAKVSERLVALSGSDGAGLVVVGENRDSEEGASQN